MKQFIPLKWSAPAMLAIAVVASCSRQTPASTASLDGNWTGFDAGQPTEKCTLAITGTQFNYHGAQSNDWCRGTFTLNEQTQPKQMDMTVQEISAPEYVGKTVLVVYELNGDELKVAAAEPGKNMRPARMAGEQGVRVFSFKRD